MSRVEEFSGPPSGKARRRPPSLAAMEARSVDAIPRGAEWCGPCRMIAPALDEISGAMGDKVKIVKLNVDESPKTASKYGVMSIPTLMIFKGGEMASRQVGAAPKAKLQQWITAAV